MDGFLCDKIKEKEREIEREGGGTFLAREREWRGEFFIYTSIFGEI